MEMGQEVAIFPEDTPTPEDESSEKVTIHFRVFFDGTLNNRANIDARLMTAPDNHLTPEEREYAKKLKEETSPERQKLAADTYNKFGANKDKHGNSDDDNSYENYYTNVVIMERYIETGRHTDEENKNHLTLSTYIEGSGSKNFDGVDGDALKEPDPFDGVNPLDEPGWQGDDTWGFAFGDGELGIPKKVEIGLRDVVEKISQSQPDKTIVIEKLVLDVFGFSRGAAAARYFIYKALFGDNSVASQLEAQGYRLYPRAVEVGFVGLYDTVSTFGLVNVVSGYDNNTRELSLDATAYAKRVVQLASADEHREYFSLTDIESARSRGTEIFLPGVHADIGGSYRDNGTERQVILDAWGLHSSWAEGERDRNQLIAAGWYRDNEITLEYSGEEDESATLHVLRKGIRNHYSRIPLQLMARFARENGVELRGKLEVVEKIPRELSEVRDHIDAYIAGLVFYVEKDQDPKNNSGSRCTEDLMAEVLEIEEDIGRMICTKKSMAEDWHFDTSGRCAPGWLRTLRHDYLHFSSRLSTGHTPRLYASRRLRKKYIG